MNAPVFFAWTTSMKKYKHTFGKLSIGGTAMKARKDAITKPTHQAPTQLGSELPADCSTLQIFS